MGKISPAMGSPVKMMRAIGRPLASVFLEPQNRIAILSALLKPNLAEVNYIATITIASITVQRIISFTSIQAEILSQVLLTTDSLKATNTTNNIVPLSTVLVIHFFVESHLPAELYNR